MNQIILPRTIFFVFILFFSMLTMASPGSENKGIKGGQPTTISQDCKVSCDVTADGLFTRNAELQVRIIRYEIPVLEKTVQSSKSNTHCYFNHHFSDQVGVRITQNLVSNPHSSILFTGVLII